MLASNLRLWCEASSLDASRSTKAPFGRCDFSFRCTASACPAFCGRLRVFSDVVADNSAGDASQCSGFVCRQCAGRSEHGYSQRTDDCATHLDDPSVWKPTVNAYKLIRFHERNRSELAPSFGRLPAQSKGGAQMRLIFVLALASVIGSSAHAHSRGFGYFFAHSQPSTVCAGQRVVATYYNSGRRTASGQAFNAGGYTAAHRTLPFGSQVTVTNPQNGASVTVVINDRGPFTRGITLDLAHGAARAIGMHGTQWVCVS